MHARINYVDIKPSSFLEVDEFWRTKVRDFAGLKGLPGHISSA